LGRTKFKTMRKITTTLLLLLLISTSVLAQQIKVAAYNIRYASQNDIGNLWQDRAPYIGSLVKFHDFDVFGTQEGLNSQLVDLDKMLPGYARYGAGRDDGKQGGEQSAIFYKKD